MIKAFKGHIQFEHLFIMQQAVDSYEFTCKQIEQCDITISKLFSQLNENHTSDVDKSKKKL
jgi:hypothetical protein